MFYSLLFYFLLFIYASSISIKPRIYSFLEEQGNSNAPVVLENLSSPPPLDEVEPFSNYNSKTVYQSNIPPPSLVRNPFDPNLQRSKSFLTQPKPLRSLEAPPLAPAGRWLHASIVIDKKVYIYGGVGRYSKQYYNDVSIYDVYNKKWTPLYRSFIPPLPDFLKGKVPGISADSINKPPDVPPPPPLSESPPEQLPYFINSKTSNNNEQKKKNIPIFSIKYPSLPPLPLNRPTPTNLLFLELKSKIRRRFPISSYSRGPKWSPQAFKSPDPYKSTISGDMWVFDTETSSWEFITPSSDVVPTPRFLHSANVIGDSIYIYGGIDFNNHILGDMWTFSTTDNSYTENTITGSKPSNREGHCTVTVENEIFMYGGINETYSELSDQLWKYIPSSNTWSEVISNQPRPKMRWLHSCQLYSTQSSKALVIYGGADVHGVPLGDLWLLDLATNTYTEIKPPVNTYPPFPRHLPSTAIRGRKFFIYGGAAANIPFEDLWVVDLASQTWEEIKNTGWHPLAREGGTLVPILLNEGDEKDPPVEPNNPLPNNIQRPNSAFSKASWQRGVPSRDVNRIYKDYTVTWYLLLFGGNGPPVS